MSNYSGYSTVSKQALALKDAELIERDLKMKKMQDQMSEMAKTIDSMSSGSNSASASGRGKSQAPRGAMGGGVNRSCVEVVKVTTRVRLN